MPCLDLAAECRPVVEHRLEVGVCRRVLVVQLECGFLGCPHDVIREWKQLYIGVVDDLLFERRGIQRVVARHHRHIGPVGGRLDDGFVLLGQRVVLVGRQLHFERGARLPPSGVVVELGHTLEVELGVVVGADPLGGVDRSGLQSLEDLASGNDLHRGAEFAHHGTAEARDAEHQALQVADRVDLLVEPATHLDAGVAGRELDHVEAVPVDLLQHREAAAVVEPGILLTIGQAERNGGSERHDLAEAAVVVRGGVPRVHAACLHRLQHLQAGDQLTCGASRHLELPAGHGGHRFGERHGTAVDGVERCRPARGDLPVEFRQVARLECVVQILVAGRGHGRGVVLR